MANTFELPTLRSTLVAGIEEADGHRLRALEQIQILEARLADARSLLHRYGGMVEGYRRVLSLLPDDKTADKEDGSGTISGRAPAGVDEEERAESE